MKTVEALSAVVTAYEVYDIFANENEPESEKTLPNSTNRAPTEKSNIVPTKSPLNKKPKV